MILNRKIVIGLTKTPKDVDPTEPTVTTYEQTLMYKNIAREFLGDAAKIIGTVIVAYVVVDAAKQIIVHHATK
jgi:hypothetical protein